MRKRALLGALLVAFATIGAPAGHAAQEADDFVEFVELESLTSEVPTGGRVLFFPLHASFGECLPLTAPCPEDSSTVMLVPAPGRRLVWRPEGADLRELELPEPRVRAIGTAPGEHSSRTYLLPVLDGAGIDLLHADRRFEAGWLVGVDDGVDDEATADGAEGSAVTPVLSGPLLSTTAPSSDLPDRLLDAPIEIDAGELVDPVPVLLARRAAPSRVVFGVQPAAAWNLNLGYIPLLDEDVIAVAAVRNGDAGIAVARPAGTRAGASPDGATRPTSDDAAREPLAAWIPAAAAGAAAIFVLAVGVIVGLARRRRRT